MKLKIITYLFVAVLTFIVLTGWKNGVGVSMSDDLTGSPFSTTGGCYGAGGACHSFGSGTTTLNLIVKDSITGNIVTNYQPNTAYKITLEGKNNNYNKFGYQLTMLDNSTNHYQAGQMFPLDTNSHIWHRGTGYNYDLIEHSRPLQQDIDSVFRVNYIWHSPTTNVGNIKIYASLNAVNGDTTSGDDMPEQSSFELFTTVNAIQNINNVESILIYPNPVQNHLYIKNLATQKYTVKIHTLNGQQIFSGIDCKTIATDSYPNGQYIVNIYDAKNKLIHTTKIIKK